MPSPDGPPAKAKTSTADILDDIQRDQGEAITSIRKPQISTRLTAIEIARNVLANANVELDRPTLSLFWSSLASGLLISFSFILGGYMMSLVPEQYGRAAASIVYPVGFILVILSRSELFTENTLTPIWAVLEERKPGAIGHTIRVWAVLLVGNLLGTLAMASVLVFTEVVPGELRPHLYQLGEHAISAGFLVTLYKGVFAGWLIALLTWLVAATSATGAQIVLIWICTWAISALGFMHAIVGSAEVFYYTLADGATWPEALSGFVLPAVVGNAIGGITLVALLNYGQVAAEVEEVKQKVEQRREEERQQRRKKNGWMRWRKGA